MRIKAAGEKSPIKRTGQAFGENTIQNSIWLLYCCGGAKGIQDLAFWFMQNRQTFYKGIYIVNANRTIYTLYKAFDTVL